MTVSPKWHMVEIQLHFVQLEHYGDLGSNLGS